MNRKRKRERAKKTGDENDNRNRHSAANTRCLCRARLLVHGLFAYFFFKPFSPKPKRSLPNTQTTQAHNNASLVQHYDKKNPKNEETETSVRHKRNKLKQEQTHQCVKRHQNRQCVKENTHRTVTTTKS